MKTKTLLSIAADIERTLGIQTKTTVNKMTEMVKAAAGHCRTKAEAAETLARDFYDYDPAEWPAMRELVASYRA